MILDFPQGGAVYKSHQHTKKGPSDFFVTLQKNILSNLSYRVETLLDLADGLSEYLEEQGADEALQERADILAAHVPLNLGEFLKDDVSVPIKEGVEEAVSLIHQEHPDLSAQVYFEVNDCVSTFPRKLMVVFFYNLVRKQVQHRHEQGQIRLFVRESAGKIKGMIKKDSLPNSACAQSSISYISQEKNAFLDPQNLDEEDLVNMLIEAGYQSSVTRYNNFSLSYEIDLNNFIDLNAKGETVVVLPIKANVGRIR